MESFKIFKFYGKDEIFSNYYQLDFVYNGYKYNCGEQGFMHQKALFFGDLKIAEEIMKTPYNPFQYKKLGRMVSGYDDTLWTISREDIMYRLILARCDYHYEYKMSLLGLKDYLIAEASPKDCIWGIGLSNDNPDSDDPYKWKGQNLLGKSYMKARDFLLQEMENC